MSESFDVLQGVCVITGKLDCVLTELIVTFSVTLLSVDHPVKYRLIMLQEKVTVNSILLLNVFGKFSY